jgi:hypothetical protein
MLITEQTRRRLQILIDQHRIWKQDVLKFCAQYSGDLSADFELEDAQGVLSNLTVAQKAERAIEERFRALLHDMNEILEPLFHSQSTLSQAISKLAAVSADPPTIFQCVLLTDPWLQELPFEGLTMFDQSDHVRVSRDFSIQLLHKRYIASSSPSVSVSASNIKYINDPWGDENTTTSNKSLISNIIADATSKNAAPGGGKWGRLRNPSQGQISAEDVVFAIDPISSNNKSMLGLISFSLGRFGSLLSPAEVAVANLEKLQIFVNIDGAHNDNSYRRQNSMDVVKPASEIALESSLCSNAVLSLCGANSILCQTWTVPYTSQHRWFSSMLTNWTTKKENILVATDKSGAVEVEGGRSKVKKWVRLSRAVFGVPDVVYLET